MSNTLIAHTWTVGPEIVVVWGETPTVEQETKAREAAIALSVAITGEEPVTFVDYDISEGRHRLIVRPAIMGVPAGFEGSRIPR